MPRSNQASQTSHAAAKKPPGLAMAKKSPAAKPASSANSAGNPAKASNNPAEDWEEF
jgi:hypothetical protein